MDDPRTYGDSFADVYDDWYGDVTDAEGTARFVAQRSGSGPVLELGIGTGRLARPMAAMGLTVIGLDASASMLRGGTDEGRPGRRSAVSIPVVQADMVALPFGGQGCGFGAVLLAFNTLFNLTTELAQRSLFRQVAPLLTADGLLIVEAMDTTTLALGPLRSMAVARHHVDGVTVVATNLDPERQTILGQHVDIRDEGVRLRPWLLRWSTADQLDSFAAAAGLKRAERYADWELAPFTATSTSHITVYRR